jgi:hypothetical protein
MRAALTVKRTGILRHSGADALLIGVSGVHAILLLTFPSVWLIALGLWWNANTVAHNFIHLPFFRSSAANRMFSGYLTLLLGIPQSLWRERHLAHHANRTWRSRASKQLVAELILLLALWVSLLTWAPLFFASVYFPGIALGLLLCSLQGRYEHINGTVSHYSRSYNWLFFNDGYHVEHHQHPTLHWRELPAHREVAAPTSRWPAVLRWIEACSLTTLERVVLRSKVLQRFVLSCHERAFRQLWPGVRDFDKITVIGGALFPRTVLILQTLAREKPIHVIDCEPDHIRAARSFIGPDSRFTEQMFHSSDAVHHARDLLVIPLSYRGDKDALYERPCGPTIIHDWVWRRGGTGVIVSWLLLKRLNLVQPCSAQ